MGWFSRKSKDPGLSQGNGKERDRSHRDISNGHLRDLVAKADRDPNAIAEARAYIRSAGDQLSNQDRIEAYRQLAAAPAYRNQRDNSKDPGSTCNLTSMAMAFEGLGVETGDTGERQGEEKLYSEFYAGGYGSRTEEMDRARFARGKGLKTQHLKTPTFASADAAKTWFLANVAPLLQGGAQATMGVKNGSFRHVVRLQWVHEGGLYVDDPYGKAASKGEGYGYQSLNAEPGTKGARKTGKGTDQSGGGDDNLLGWDIVAASVSDRYVQVYNK